jgi:hypothetical protein
MPFRDTTQEGRLIDGPVYWVLPFFYPDGGAPLIQLGREKPFVVTGRLALKAPTGKPWRNVTFTLHDAYVLYGLHADDEIPNFWSQDSVGIEGANNANLYTGVAAQSEADGKNYALRMDALKHQIVTDYGAVSNPGIFDATSGVNTALDTGILDLSQWRTLLVILQSSGGVPAFVGNIIDDAGVNFVQAFNLAANATIGWGAGFVNNSVLLPLSRRARFTSSAIVGQTSRIRIEGRR